VKVIRVIVSKRAVVVVAYSKKFMQLAYLIALMYELYDIRNALKVHRTEQNNERSAQRDANTARWL